MKMEKEYKYRTAEEAIISLEEAYTNFDLEGVFASKYFELEAKIMLDRASFEYNLEDKELINQTALLLQTSLHNSLLENGFPSFENVKREFSEIKNVDNEIYMIKEHLIFVDGDIEDNIIYLSNKNGLWKVALVEE